MKTRLALLATRCVLPLPFRRADDYRSASITRSSRRRSHGVRPFRDGSGTLTYQWSKNGTNIANATTTALSFTNLLINRYRHLHDHGKRFLAYADDHRCHSQRLNWIAPSLSNEPRRPTQRRRTCSACSNGQHRVSRPIHDRRHLHQLRHDSR